MTTNGSAHKFNKNHNNWLHKHFEPQQVDVVVSSISILGLDSLSAFARTHPLTTRNDNYCVFLNHSNPGADPGILGRVGQGPRKRQVHRNFQNNKRKKKPPVGVSEPIIN